MHSKAALCAVLLPVFLVVAFPLVARADQPSSYQAPRFKEQVKPAYPASARAAKEAGVVFVKVLIGSDGKAKSFSLKSSGFRDLDEAVLAAAKASSYAPALRNGKPVVAFYDFSYAFTLAGLQEMAAANDELERKLQQDPKNVANRLALTQSYLDKADYAQAEATAQKGVTLLPGEARLWSQLGSAYYLDGQAKNDGAKLKQAADAFDHAASLGPAINSAQAAGAYAAYAFDLMNQQRYQDCLQYADKAAQLSAKEMQYRMLKADCESGVGNYDAALTDYNKAQLLDDRRNPVVTSRLLAGMGNAQLNSAHEAAGLESLNAAEKISPQSPFAYQYLSSYFLAKGNLNAALNPLMQLAQLQPDSPQVQVNLGDIYVRQRNFAAAQSAYVKASTLDPRNGDALFGQAALAAAQVQIGNIDTPLQKAVALAPANTAVYNATIATLLLQQPVDRLDQSPIAERYAHVATQADPAYPDGWFALGIALGNQTKKAEANVALRKAFDLFKGRNDQPSMRAVTQAYLKLNGKDSGWLGDAGRKGKDITQPGDMPQ